MESGEENKYQVIITEPAEISFYEILEYLYDNYSIERAEEIGDNLRDTTNSLHFQPERGIIESRLSHRSNNYRFILYKRTNRAEIKIIYYINQSFKHSLYN